MHIEVTAIIHLLWLKNENFLFTFILNLIPSEPKGFLFVTLLSTRLKAVEQIENPFVPVMDYHDKSITADIEGH